MRRYFPRDDNGSRILLTSRLLDMATYASEGVPPHFVRLLNLEESKKLLCSKIFADESNPEELLAIGEKIVDKCHGLPLAIVVVGGLLAKKRRETKDWEEVAENVGSLVMEGPQCCEKILSLSYNHLSEPLKACFLYMGIFPKDFEITSKRLKYLWIAEGFVLTEEQKTLEQVAEVYLKDLIDRSLIMVKQKSSNGGIKICQIHDLMRDLCLKESQKQNFLRVIRRTEQYTESQENVLYNSRRIAIHSHLGMYMKRRASFPSAHSFFCFETLRPIDLKGYSGMYFTLLKILDIMQVHLLSLPPGILLLHKLKYLAVTIKNSIPLLELSKLCNLQTCIIDGEWSGELYRELWDMIEIRHFSLKYRLSHAPNEDYSFILSGLRIMENLQSLLTVCPNSCTEEILSSMPNLKKLGVRETEDDYLCRDWFKNLICLEHLETLKYAFSNPFAHVKPERFPSWSMFPPNLMKLTLSGTSFPWEDMDKLSMLPKLEVLKLKNYAFCGSHWDMGENCFCHLKYLQIGSTNLEEWFVDESHFPMLQHLVLRHCRSLKDIPYDIGNAPSLEKIELHCCSESAVTSARGLHEEQIGMGNLCLRVYITKR